MQLIYNLIYRFTPFLPRSVDLEYVYSQKDTDPIYIRNTTNKLDVGFGEVCIAFPIFAKDGTEKLAVLFLPKTSLPINALKQISKFLFIESSEVRKGIFEGMFEILHPRFAKYLLSTKESKEEYLSIVKQDYKLSDRPFSRGHKSSYL